MVAGMEGSYEGSEETREESLREVIDIRLIECRDAQVTMQELVKALVATLLPPSESDLPEAPKENPQGWLEEVRHELDVVRDVQHRTAEGLVRLKRAVNTGILKAAK